MNIKFNQPCQFEVISSFDENNDPVGPSTKTFLLGQEVVVDIVDVNWEYRTATIQFDDGSVVFGVPLSCFEPIGFDLEKEFPNIPITQPDFGLHSSRCLCQNCGR